MCQHEMRRSRKYRCRILSASSFGIGVANDYQFKRAEVARGICAQCVEQGGQCGVCDPWFGVDFRRLDRPSGERPFRLAWEAMHGQKFNAQYHEEWNPCMACGSWLNEEGLRCRQCRWKVHAGCTQRFAICHSIFCTMHWEFHSCLGSTIWPELLIRGGDDRDDERRLQRQEKQRSRVTENKPLGQWRD